MYVSFTAYVHPFASDQCLSLAIARTKVQSEGDQHQDRSEDPNINSDEDEYHSDKADNFNSDDDDDEEGEEVKDEGQDDEDPDMPKFGW